MSKHTRRQFLERLASAGAAAPFVFHRQSALAQAPSPVKNTQGLNSAIPTKIVLSSSDLSYAGAFRIPVDANNGGSGDSAWGSGLTFRYVNGQLRFLSTNSKGTVFEMAAPGLGTDPYSAPLASMLRYWDGVSAAGYTGSGSFHVYGLYWDPIDSRLYWSYGDQYNANYPTDPSVGYSVLNDATGAVSSVGCWRVGPSCKMAQGGVVPVPSWFAQAYTGGQRLAAGFGGYFSIVTAGPASMGPSLFAFAPPNITSQPSRSAVASTPLVSYPFSATAYGPPDRCHRDTDYVNQFDGWNPNNGVGYWDWTDYLWQGAVWVDLPSKHGVLFFPTLGNGNTYYANSTLNAERASHGCFIYDPTSFAVVALGKKQRYEIQPSQRGAIRYPGLVYPLPGWADEPGNMVIGATYDPATHLLYVAVRFVWSTGGIPPNGTVVYAYHVNG